MKTDLSKYDNSWYNPGSRLKRFVWYFINEIFLKNSLNPSSSLKISLLKLFGSRIGIGVIIKPGVNIKYPWKLKIGNYCWIGEDVWIDNLAEVTLMDNVCVSQGAFLLCGNHNFKSTYFDLQVKPIVLEEGCWIGAKSIVAPGIRVGSHAVLSINSVASKNLEPYKIYRGNPAQITKERIFET